MTGYRLGVDVGGTFTDIVVLTPEGKAYSRKVLSSPPEFNVAIREGIAGLLAGPDLAAADIAEVTHGATVATNAIITRTGAVTGLITTEGFRDVLEIRRMRMHRLYDIHWEKPKPLVPRHLRLEVPERLDSNANVVTPLDEDAVREAVERLQKDGVESVAISFLHAYASDAHERRVREILRELAPEMWVSLSSEVLPEIKEYERTSTTVINAYVQPPVDRYARAMQADLAGLDIDVPVMVMQSNGGMMPLDSARAFPMHIIESGPAAGVTGVYHLARRMGIKDALSLDMGGTTAKAGLVEDGEICRSPEYEVGGDISIGHRLMKGSGYLLRVPSIDIAEVGAGGGSIAWIDPGGALKVGPQSAGAAPGPACYGLGGTEPTITDANVHLGLTNPEFLAGGTLPIQPELAEQAIRDKLAGALGLDVTAAAWGVRNVANSSLVRALRAVSTERGRDPRDFVVFAFGGMGPVQALDVADELGIDQVVVPPLPGLFSALGLLFAEVEHHLIQTHFADTDGEGLERLNATLARLGREAGATLEREGYEAARQQVTLSLDTRYAGQDHALSIQIAGAPLATADLEEVVAAFHAEHERTYGYQSDGEQVQVVAVRCVARGRSETPRVPDRLSAMAETGQRASGARRCYFGPERGWIETEVVARETLSQGPIDGPAIIEEDSALTVVLPGWRAQADEWSNIVLGRSGG